MAAEPDNAAAGIEADDHFDDGDSALGAESLRYSTTSLSSSILRFREENGRTYHAYKDGKYILPNDESEKDRLDLQHHLFLMTFGSKLALCPLGKKLKRVLDIGTGTGIWAIDFADEHPEAEVIGVDLSPIQPEFLPPNLKFEVDDVEELWTFAYQFDYIHIRCMNACLADWPKVMKQAYDNLEPGGWIELQDCEVPWSCDDNSYPADCPSRQWMNYVLEAGEKMGRPVDTVQRFKQLVLDAGFEDVEELIFKWPSNTWPKDLKYKELGAWNLANFDGGLEGMSLAMFTRVLGWSTEEVLAFLTGVRKDFRNRSIHTYFAIHVVYGRKPKTADAS